jgi:hypothetical protein
VNRREEIHKFRPKFDGAFTDTEEVAAGVVVRELVEGGLFEIWRIENCRFIRLANIGRKSDTLQMSKRHSFLSVSFSFPSLEPNMSCL